MRVRERRLELGWSQAKLAQRAGVSRQLVSAVESGRHEPSVSAAIAIAAALGASVEELFGASRSTVPAVPVTGRSLPAGPVRAGWVHGRAVVAPVSVLDELDGLVPHGRWTGSALELEEGARPAAVVLAGCEPALGVLAETVGSQGGAWWVKTSSAEARSALVAGRAHVAAIHDRVGRLPTAPDDVVALVVARWRVGVAFDRSRAATVLDAVGRGEEVVQREQGAGTQAAFDRWLRRTGLARPPGPRASGHVDACRLIAAGAAVAGVTVEPAAAAAGLAFEALEEHEVRLWCPRAFLSDPLVGEVIDRLTSSALRRRLATLPAYDLERLGEAVA